MKPAYFSWISNLGVVPLFLLAAFLFTPCFLSLFLLIFLNCFVFEPILTTPALYLNIFSIFVLHLNKVRPLYLYILDLNVKRYIIGISLLFTLNAHSQTFFIAKGQQKEFPSINVHRFSIGNKEVIAHKLLKFNKRLQVRGKSLGFSDLIIWDTRGLKHQFKFYVLSKIQHLKTVNLAEILKSLGLKSQIKGQIVKTTGKLKTLSDYKLFHKLLKDHPQNLHPTVYLSLKLKKILIARVYKNFIKNGFINISCDAEAHNLFCRYYSAEEEIKKFVTFYKKQFFIKFFKLTDLFRLDNYQMQLKVLQIEYFTQAARSIGLNQLNAMVGDYLLASSETEKTISLIGKNKILFQNKNYKISTIASPEAILKLNTPLIIKLGNEFQSLKSSEQKQDIYQWKFSGLKVKLKLKKKSPQVFQLDYDAHYSTQISEGLSTSTEKTSVHLSLGKLVQLFKIGVRSEAKSNESLPFLGSIPILKSLFEQKHSSTQYREIIGHIIIRREHYE